MNIRSLWRSGRTTFIQKKAYADYEDKKAWAKKMLVNISKAGFFSSDRTIKQYNDEIWHLEA